MDDNEIRNEEIRYGEIRYEALEDQIVQITLNRPEKRNPLGPTTLAELCHALETARDDASVRVVILTGAGPVFSAGGDLSLLAGQKGSAGSQAPPRSFVDLNMTFTKMGKPTIAKVNGPAMAGGLGLVIACDLAVASEQATFGTPEIKVGLWPMMIMANIFRNVGRKAGLRMILTGEKLTAAQASQIGLINEAVPPADLDEHTLELARKVARHSPAVMRLGLQAFYGTQDMPIDQALPELQQQLGAVLATEDAKEGLMAFMQKRAPKFSGR